MKARRLLITALTFFILFLPAKGFQAESSFKKIVSSKKIMVVFAGNNEYAEYAENIMKEKLSAEGYSMVNPEMMEKVKKDKLLWEAIQNTNATAMARISTDFGADILLKGTLTVESHSRFTTQWEASASLNVTVIDTKTADELLSSYSNPLGSTEHPMPVEESSLVAKQVAVKKVTENVALKLGLSSSEDVYGKTTFAPKFYKNLNSSGRVKRVLFSPDSSSIAIVNDHFVDIMEINSGRQIARYEVSDTITSISFSKAGGLIAIGGSGKSVYVYETKNNTLRKQYSGSSSSVRTVALSNEGTLLAAGFKDGHIELIDVRQGERIGNMSGHSEVVNSLAFTPNDKFLVSFSDDLLTKFWDVNVKRETRSFKETMDRLFFACLSVDGSLIGLNGKDIEIDLLRNRRMDKRFLVIKNTNTGEELKRFNLPKDISAIAFYPNKRYIASASQDNTVRIWDINTGEEISVLSLEKSAASLDFSNDGKMLAYAIDNVVTVVRL